MLRIGHNTTSTHYLVGYFVEETTLIDNFRRNISESLA